MKVAILASLLIIATLSASKTDTDYLWPRPSSYTYDEEGEDLI